MDVSSVAPLRDLRPASVPALVAVLEDWDLRCDSVLAEIEAHVVQVRRAAQETRRREIDNEKAVERAMGEDGWKDKGRGAGKRGAREAVDRDGGTADGGDEMDVDEGGSGRGRPRAPKRGGGGRMAGMAKKWVA